MRAGRQSAIAAGTLAMLALTAGTAVAATRSITIGDNFFNAAATSATAGDNLTWSNGGFSAHTTTSDFPAPVGWNSGDVARGATYSKVVTAAGTFTYHCSRHFGMAGSVAVPVVVTPATGGTGTTFTVKVASAAAPTGFQYVVTRKVPGSTSFAAWKTTTSASLPFVADKGKGSYTFRSQVKQVSTGKITAPSPAKAITVS